MKILVADDMEGITGVVDWSQVDPNHAEYARFRKLMTADVNAAIRGAFNAGATEVVVADGHDSGRNILVEEMDPRASLNSGSPSPISMVQGIDQGVDAMLMVGYHARAGTQNAVLCHTWWGEITNVWLNGQVIGEIGLNASVAGWFGVPVLMISGCRAACAEASELIAGIETAVVKIASGRYAAECLPPLKTQEMIQSAAERAVQKFAQGQGPRPHKVEGQVVARVEFTHPAHADGASLMPGTTRVNGCTVEFTAPDVLAAYRIFRAATNLAG